MYYPNRDQENHPENYVLANVSMNVTEDECHDFLSKPRQTQTTIGLQLRKKRGVDNERAEKEETAGGTSPSQRRAFPNEVDHNLEHALKDNKGFWVDKPTLTAPLVYKLRELYTVELPKKDPKKGQGIFFRPDYLESEYLIKLGQAGLLYPDEEITDSEEEIKPDETMCLPLRKKKYKICDPCKPKEEKKKSEEEVKKVVSDGLPFKKIMTGCQCNYYGEHNKEVTVWDVPFLDEVDMIRNHEMDKYLRPFKTELFNRIYKENPPVFFTPTAKEAKKTFPDLMLSNL